MHTKQRILIFTDWYLPGFKAGGPIRSLANLVQSLEHEFFIVTRITDHHSTVPYPGITPNVWIKLTERVHVVYFEESKLTGSNFKSLLKENQYDRIYFNSLFSPRFTLLPLRTAKKLGLTSQCVLAPRGMLKSGALSIKSNKKKLFLYIAKMTRLYKGIRWHATNEEEANEIKQHFGRECDVRISPNIAIAASTSIKKPLKSPGELRLICIARISPEKGILEAIQFLKAAELKGRVVCDFYGTQQNAAYLSTCQKLASTIPGTTINFPGEIEPTRIPELMSGYHFFYMTTWGENFGHAIAEALLSGTPAIISDRTPWKSLQENHAGWELPLESAAFARVLKLCFDMEEHAYSLLSREALEYGQKIAHDPAVIEAGYAIFEK